MIAIYKKEMRSFLNSLVGWLFVAVNLFFAGWNFKYYGLTDGRPYVSYVISGVMMIFLFSMPILSMRIFSEEARQRTNQLLYTSPISVWKIILGKYLALISIFAIPVIVMCLYPLIQMIYGKVPIPENYLALLGFFLFGSTCLAIGLFISSLTDNQVIAAVITFCILLFMASSPSISNLINQNGNWLTKVLSIFNITKFLDDFQLGILSFPAFFYFISVTFIALFLTGVIILRKRWSTSEETRGKIVGNLFLIITIVGGIVLINIILNILPSTYFTTDLTYNNIYSLTSETKKQLESVTNPVTLYYLTEAKDADSTINSTLTEMASYSPYITLQYVSLSKDPTFSEKFPNLELKENSVIVQGSTKYRVIDALDFFNVKYEYYLDEETGKYKTQSYKVTGYDGEGKLMAAISYVDSPELSKIYCITGHNEYTMEDELVDSIEKANILWEYINLFDYEEIPDDADAIILLGPLFDYSDEDNKKVQDYLHKGGNAIAFISFIDGSELEKYYSLFSEYNIHINNGLLMEQGSSFYNSEQYYLLPEILNTDITKDVYSNLRTKYIYMPMCKGMSITEDCNDVTMIPLLQTTENAYLDLSNDDKTLTTGRYYTGLFATKTTPDYESKLIVFSSDYFLYPSINTAVYGNNYKMLIKSLSTIIGDEIISNIPSKEYTYNVITIDQMAVNIISIVLIVVFPLGFIAVGTVIVRKRNKQ